jgi:hypothetical protein
MEWLDIEALQQVVVNSLSELGARVAGFVPSFLGMVIILLIGWVIASVVAGIATRVIARAGLDKAAGRLGITEILQEAGIGRPPSGTIGRLLYWLLMLTFVLSAVETLGLTAVTQTIDRLIAFLPDIIAASLIVILGLLLARFVGNLVGSGAAAADMPYARQLGGTARGAMVIMVSILAIEQLGVDAAILLWAVITVLAATCLGLGLAFALGARDVVGSILAGYYLRKSLEERVVVSINGRQGTLDRIGPVHTVFRSDQGTWSVPNTELLGAHIDRA